MPAMMPAVENTSTKNETQCKVKQIRSLALSSLVLTVTTLLHLS